MGFAELVGQVGLVGVFHECLVVDEEHDGGNGNDRVFLVESSGGVEELHAFCFVVSRRGVLEHGRLEDAVELAGAGNVLSSFFDGNGLLEDMLGGVSGFRRAGDEGCVGEKKEFATDVLLGLGDTLLVVGTGMIEIKFIEDDEAGFFLFQDELCDFSILRGYACGEIDNKDAEVGTTYGFFRAYGGENLDRVVALAAWAEACGIDDGEVFPREGVREIDGIASGASDLGNDGALVF